MDTSELDNGTASAVLEMMRMAEFWLNSRTQNAFDVVLGVRHLPPMQPSTLFWHLSDFS